MIKVTIFVPFINKNRHSFNLIRLFQTVAHSIDVVTLKFSLSCYPRVPYEFSKNGIPKIKGKSISQWNLCVSFNVLPMCVV